MTTTTRTLNQLVRLASCCLVVLISSTCSAFAPVLVKNSRRIQSTNAFKLSSSSSQLFFADNTSVAVQEPTEPLTMATTFMMASSKFRRLKDLMWIRETLEDLTTAEFASSLDATQREGQRKRKRAIDYDKLLGQLNNRLKDLGCVADDNQTPPVPGKGMGALVYTDDQREALYTRIIKTRHALTVAMTSATNTTDDLLSTIALPELSFKVPDQPRLYVRDDGLADWDGALQDRAAMRAFGRAVWARINGVDPDSVSEEGEDEIEKHHGTKAAVTAKINDTEEICRQRDKLRILEAELKSMEREYTLLLKSAISAGQAVANVNLANLDQVSRAKIEASRLALDKKKEQVWYQSLVYELERIYTYLAGELESPVATGYIPIQDRLNIAEFGLLESQVATFEPYVAAGEMVDVDVLKVVLDTLTDFKSRLGIDYYVTGVKLDPDAFQRWLGTQWARTQEGLAFYAKGVRLLAGDVAFCLNLFGRALQGYTLKPREVRYLRRTLTDVTNFIPFIIILIIPLSPIGHVAVFGAIQKWYPDFFPSFFTERRQNLLRLYETTEYSEVKINESWNAKLSRLIEACAFFVSNGAQNLFRKMTGSAAGDDNDTNGQQ